MASVAFNGGPEKGPAEKPADTADYPAEDLPRRRTLPADTLRLERWNIPATYRDTAEVRGGERLTNAHGPLVRYRKETLRSAEIHVARCCRRRLRAGLRIQRR